MVTTWESRTLLVLKHCRGVEQRQLVGLITRRSSVQIRSPQPFLLQTNTHGGVAQMARACGSYPQCQRFNSVHRYQFRPYGQAVKTPPFHGGNPSSILGRVTNIYPERYLGSIAQLGEHLPYKQGVTGSSPVTPTIILYGDVSEWLKGTDCKSVSFAFAGSNPAISTKLHSLN